MQNSIYCVVLNWNNYKESVNCIESLISSEHPHLQIVIVDNASRDGSGAMLASNFPQFRYIQTGSNLGFAKGCNAGCKWALEQSDCEALLLLNNDAILKPASLAPALATLRSSPRVGAVGGKILRMCDRTLIWSAGGEIDLIRCQARTTGFGETDRGQYDYPRKVSFITCAMILVKASVMRQVGLLPEQYFFGYEEWDFSMMLSRSGFELWYDPEFVSYHDGDGSHSNSDPKFIYNSYRNKFIFARRNLGPMRFALWRFAFEKVYRRFFIQRHWRHIHPVNSPFDDFDFALSRAIDDFNQSGMSEIIEKDLMDFSTALAKRNNSQT